MTGGDRSYRRRWQRPASASAPRSFARKVLDFLLMAIFFALVALLAARLNKREPVEPLVGKAYVIDGDTISIAGNHIRLKGIDAPELTQSCGNASALNACGQVSRQTLIRLIGGRPVRCAGDGHDKYNRSLATCFIDETNLNQAMVEAGQAIAYGDYHDAEVQARRAKKGLWGTTFEVPQDWRREHEEELPELPQQQPNRPAELVDQFLDWINRLLGGLW
jgi:endonuclease YncB( thermonuclease family)